MAREHQDLIKIEHSITKTIHHNHFDESRNNHEWCGKPKACKQEKATCDMPQIDTCHIIFKLSNPVGGGLERIGEREGSSLTNILMSINEAIDDYQSIEFPNIPNRPDIKSFKDLVSYLLQEQKNQEEINNNLIKEIEHLRLSLDRINNSLSILTKANLVDTKGIGFTKNDSLIKVIQTIINN